MKQPVERRLAAILAADVAGYSRLMGADEEGTHERLTAHFRELVDPKIKQHRGRTVKNTGDGMLAEFPSIVDAVRCAAEIQCGMIDRNTDTSEDQRISFRIGINLGDVIVVRAYAMSAAAVASLAAVQPVAPTREVVEPLTSAASRLSIVVLPFTNLSNDPEQEYFADGITDDLTSDLSRISGSFVIARNTAFTYKGKPVNVKQVGRELGVRYVLERQCATNR